MNPIRVRITLWSVSNQEFDRLTIATHQRVGEWENTANLQEKTWIGSLDKRYWGAIMRSEGQEPIDYNQKTNIGRQITGRDPVFDEEFTTIEKISKGGAHD